jgi:hypothetical protein
MKAAVEKMKGTKEEIENEDEKKMGGGLDEDRDEDEVKLRVGMSVCA